MEPEGDFHTEPMCIIDKTEIQLQKHTIVQAKVQWKHYLAEETTWKIEEIMRQNFPALFQDFNNTD